MPEFGKDKEGCPHVTLADERLKELDNPSLTTDERALLRCRVAADLIHKGQYEGACEALGELWSGVGQRPDVDRLKPATAAEVLLQCGVLTGWIGDARNVPGAQEKAKDLLTEALRAFQSQGSGSKAAEAQYELGMCYWRLGQYDEIGRAHVCTPVTWPYLVCRLLLEKKKKPHKTPTPPCHHRHRAPQTPHQRH